MRQAEDRYDTINYDNNTISSGRFRKATSDLYFSLEHVAKALLLSIGIRTETHKGVARLLSYPFVKPGLIPLQIVIYLENLCERRKTAEYSSRAGWEFTSENVKTYKA